MHLVYVPRKPVSPNMLFRIYMSWLCNMLHDMLFYLALLCVVLRVVTKCPVLIVLCAADSYCIIYYCFSMCCIVFYCMILSSIVLHCLVLYCITMFCAMPYCVILYVSKWRFHVLRVISCYGVKCVARLCIFVS